MFAITSNENNPSRFWLHLTRSKHCRVVTSSDCWSRFCPWKIRPPLRLTRALPLIFHAQSPSVTTFNHPASSFQLTQKAVWDAVDWWWWLYAGLPCRFMDLKPFNFLFLCFKLNLYLTHILKTFYLEWVVDICDKASCFFFKSSIYRR